MTVRQMLLLVTLGTTQIRVIAVQQFQCLDVVYTGTKLAMQARDGKLMHLVRIVIDSIRPNPIGRGTRVMH